MSTPTDIIRATLEAGGRVLLAGAPGTGKSTLASALAASAASAGIDATCIGCDPGSPAFGIPGAVCTGRWEETGWALVDVEPLCTLDAARFRLPLVHAVARLLERSTPHPRLLDAPGTVRGVPGAELVTALATAASADLVVLFERDGSSGALAGELHSLGFRLAVTRASEQAHLPSKPTRARHRTALWEAYLSTGASEHEVDIDALSVVGTPPPRDATAAWQGRQIALLRNQACIGVGEIIALDGPIARLMLRGDPRGATAAIVRDAQRGPEGLLATAEPFEREASGRRPAAPPRRRAISAALERAGGRTSIIRDAARDYVDAERGRHGAENGNEALDPACEARSVVRVGPFAASLVNGVFGDPLLLVRLRHGGRTLLFDLGETHVLGARVAHRVTDVFISHAHVDHIGGFLWLLRSRIGEASICRVYGPPGIAANVSGLVNGVHWDRAGEGAPRFEVTERDRDGGLQTLTVKAGDPTARRIGERRTRDGLLLDEPLLRVRAVMLDHLTPVLAFALESPVEISVRKDRLAALGLAPGPWLARLKDEIAAGRHDGAIDLPDGSKRSVRELADALTLLRPGTKLVYATDLADTSENRRRLAALALDADVLFCESTFREADADRAARTGHLTTRACGEIASAARVARLVPFHFSRRYEADPNGVYREVQAAVRKMGSEPIFPRKNGL